MGFSKPEIRLIKVLLPDPDGPVIPSIEPNLIFSEKLLIEFEEHLS